jgi:hypothetical protein
MHQEYYDTSSPIIEYYNDFEYRKCIRQIFKMDEEKMKADLAERYDIADIDPLTLDEFMIDMTVMENALQKLYALTCSQPQFCELYDLAAAKMFSTNREIGQSILYCYDYVYVFHPLMCAFLECPGEITHKHKYFKQLKECLMKK